MSRAEETEKATLGEGDFPIGNWIHTFDQFQEIVDALQVQLSIGKKLEEIVVRQHLRRELMSNIREMTEKESGKIVRKNWYISMLRQSFTGGYDDAAHYNSHELNSLTLYAFFGTSAGRQLSTRAIENAIYSGIFLKYDLLGDVFKTTLIHDALQDLRDNIYHLNDMQRAARDLIMNFHLKYRKMGQVGQQASITNQELVPIIAVFDTQENVIDLLIALVKALKGKMEDLESLRLRPSSPLEIEAKELEKTKPTLVELEDWVHTQ